MKKKLIISLTIILIILVMGFIMSLFIESSKFCTKMWCKPQENLSYAEIPCNSCTQRNPVFVTGFVNVIRSCDGKEILVFENSEYVPERKRIDVDKSSCVFDVLFFRVSP